MESNKIINPRINSCVFHILTTVNLLLPNSVFKDYRQSSGVSSGIERPEMMAGSEMKMRQKSSTALGPTPNLSL